MPNPENFAADTSPSNDDQSFRSSVVIDKLQLLYRQSSHGVFGALVAGVIWAAIVWQYPSEANRTAVSIWLIALALASGLRLLLFFAHRRANPSGEAVKRWQMPYVVTLAVSSLIWGVGTVLVVHDTSTLLLVVTYAFLLGLAGSALSGYGVFAGLTLFVLITILLPVMAALTMKAEVTTVLLAVGGLWFFVTAMRGLRVHNKAVDESFRLAHQLRETSRIAQQQAQTDWLTGLRNRRAFVETAEAVLSLVAREQYPATMMLIDIDGFKEINDSYGHAAGDAALAHLGGLLTETLRRSDVCGRLGGDEFAVLLPRTTTDGARGVAYKLCKLAASQRINYDGKLISITLSIGLAAGPGDCESLLQRADDAMYAAKRAGKNQFAEA
jgi:diguanylate cyclase